MTDHLVDPIPAGITGSCFLALAMLGGQGTTTQVRQLLAAEGERLTLSQVRTSLHSLARRKRPLVVLARPGQRWFHDPGRWELAGYGRALLCVSDSSS